MDFVGKGYGAKREFNFVTNGKKSKIDVNEDDLSSFMKLACNVIFTQMSATTCIKKYEESAVAAMINEFTQLNEGTVPGKQGIIPIDNTTLTNLEKKKVLPAVNLITEKWNEELKGRPCVDGSKQRRYLKEDESYALPTSEL